MTKDMITVAIAQVLLDEKTSVKVMEEKYLQLRRLESYLQQFRNDHYEEFLLEQICEKKIEYLTAPTTIGEIKEIMAPPKPYFDGNQFRDSTYQVDAEELIGWSRASLCAPLNGYALQRMEDLFERVYGQPLDKFTRDGADPHKEVG